MIGPKGLVGAIFALGGGLFLILPVWQIVGIQIDRMTGVTVSGEVVGVSIDGSMRAARRPVAAFRDEDGVRREALGWIGVRQGIRTSPRLTHAIGSQVSLSYPEGRPQDARFSDAKSQLMLGLIAAAGLLFASLGAWLIRADRREMREDGWIR
ncbi:DUF3592 domain-containing protein [Parerythrobacter aurantius]|uniref:DUF3592 domain-containing protein n=1 Tax=Parerythrobacter aurantius TaxID=3127706 RepID=UPI0032479E3F